jgi:hypothetical protein
VHNLGDTLDRIVLDCRYLSSSSNASFPCFIQSVILDSLWRNTHTQSSRFHLQLGVLKSLDQTIQDHSFSSQGFWHILQWVQKHAVIIYSPFLSGNPLAYLCTLPLTAMCILRKTSLYIQKALYSKISAKNKSTGYLLSEYGQEEMTYSKAPTA